LPQSDVASIERFLKRNHARVGNVGGHHATLDLAISLDCRSVAVKWETQTGRKQIVNRESLLVMMFATVLTVTGMESYAAEPEKGTVKVFLLVGQSNMEGKAHIRTLETLIADPKTASQYKHLKDGDKWAVRNDVWVYYPRRGGVAKGALSVGFGDSSEKIGPELGIGIELGDHFDQQVLLIKCAWGGKSLKTDFLPPSAGGPGEFYTKTIQQTRDVLNNLKTHFPDYDGKGYEIAGLIWFQGWNDAGDPSHYTEQFAHFIRDVRKEFKTPNMPVVIGQMGHGGMKQEIRDPSVQKAQADVANILEFKGNVLCVSTREYWDEEAAQLFEVWRSCAGAAGQAKRQNKSEAEIKACWESWEKVQDRYGQIASDRPYHYCGSGRCFYGMGKAMGQGMAELLKK